MVQSRLLFLLHGFSDDIRCPFSERMIIMHYATLVTVEIEPCEEDMVRVIGARSLDIYQSEVKMRSTVFSSRMAEEVDTVMEPFYCETDNPDYLEFEDKTEEYWEAYENETVNLVRFPNGTVLTEIGRAHV